MSFRGTGGRRSAQDQTSGKRQRGGPCADRGVFVRGEFSRSEQRQKCSRRPAQRRLRNNRRTEHAPGAGEGADGTGLRKFFHDISVRGRAGGSPLFSIGVGDGPLLLPGPVQPTAVLRARGQSLAAPAIPKTHAVSYPPDDV